MLLVNSRCDCLLLCLGQERFGNMTRVYYKEAVGCFIVFDITRPSTFEAVERWKKDLDSKVSLPDGCRIPCVLLANKVSNIRSLLRKARLLHWCFLHWLFLLDTIGLLVIAFSVNLLWNITSADVWSKFTGWFKTEVRLKKLCYKVFYVKTLESCREVISHLMVYRYWQET